MKSAHPYPASFWSHVLHQLCVCHTLMSVCDVFQYLDLQFMQVLLQRICKVILNCPGYMKNLISYFKRF